MHKVLGSGRWLRTSTRRRQHEGWCFMCLPPLPSLSANGYLREPKKALPLPASEGVLVVGPLPYLRSAAPRWRGCAIMKAVALQSWRVCSRSAQALSGGRHLPPYPNNLPNLNFYKTLRLPVVYHIYMKILKIGLREDHEIHGRAGGKSSW